MRIKKFENFQSFFSDLWEEITTSKFIKGTELEKFKYDEVKKIESILNQYFSKRGNHNPSFTPSHFLPINLTNNFIGSDDVRTSGLPAGTHDMVEKNPWWKDYTNGIIYTYDTYYFNYYLSVFKDNDSFYYIKREVERHDLRPSPNDIRYYRCDDIEGLEKCIKFLAKIQKK